MFVDCWLYQANMHPQHISLMLLTDGSDGIKSWLAMLCALCGQLS